MFETLRAADAAGYLMGAGTSGSGNNLLKNECGISESHAFSILATFTMIDKDGLNHNCLLMRNPWGVVFYNKEWSKDDPAWTDELVAQVPWGVDVR